MGVARRRDRAKETSWLSTRGQVPGEVRAAGSWLRLSTALSDVTPAKGGLRSFPPGSPTGGKHHAPSAPRPSPPLTSRLIIDIFSQLEAKVPTRLRWGESLGSALGSVLPWKAAARAGQGHGHAAGIGWRECRREWNGTVKFFPFLRPVHCPPPLLGALLSTQPPSAGLLFPTDIPMSDSAGRFR